MKTQNEHLEEQQRKTKTNGWKSVRTINLEKKSMLYKFFSSGLSNKFNNKFYILPRNPEEISFKETVLILKKIFREKCSLFNT